MQATQNCPLCDEPITSQNDTDEHVLPQALGGRLKVSGFICRNCNSSTGHQWDSDLVKELNPLALQLGIKRERGKPPSQLFETVNGEKILVNPDGTLDMAKPTHSVTPTDDGLSVNIQARNHREARKILDGLIRKHAPGGVTDRKIEFKETTDHFSNPIKMSFSIGGETMGRSIVKSALAFAKLNGIDPHTCTEALAYLRGGAVPCFGFYDEKELISHRPSDVLHIVAITANPKTGLILGYVELFSCYQQVICLSRQYTGSDISACHAIDPITGVSHNLEISLPFSKVDIQEIYDYKRVSFETTKLRMNKIMELIIKRSGKLAFDRAVHAAFSHAQKMTGIGEEDTIPHERYNEFIGYFWEKFQPYVISQIAKTRMPIQ